MQYKKSKSTKSQDKSQTHCKRSNRRHQSHYLVKNERRFSAKLACEDIWLSEMVRVFEGLKSRSGKVAPESESSSV